LTSFSGQAIKTHPAALKPKLKMKPGREIRSPVDQLAHG
jgi:hypothetical protein